MQKHKALNSDMLCLQGLAHLQFVSLVVWSSPPAP